MTTKQHEPKEGEINVLEMDQQDDYEELTGAKPIDEEEKQEDYETIPGAEISTVSGKISIDEAEEQYTYMESHVNPLEQEVIGYFPHDSGNSVQNEELYEYIEGT